MRLVCKELLYVSKVACASKSTLLPPEFVEASLENPSEQVCLFQAMVISTVCWEVWELSVLFVLHGKNPRKVSPNKIKQWLCKNVV